MDESHIDLGRLAAFAGARLIHSCVQSLNLEVSACPLCLVLVAGDDLLRTCSSPSMCRPRRCTGLCYRSDPLSSDLTKFGCKLVPAAMCDVEETGSHIHANDMQLSKQFSTRELQ